MVAACVEGPALNWLTDLLRVRSQKVVFLWTGLVVVLCVAAPVLSVAALLSNFPWLPPRFYWGVLAVAGVIPLIIVPPIAFVALNILRLMTLTIEKVDEFVRYDTLTGVLSRAYLLGKTRDALPGGGSFLMVDADHFKSINDTHGHDIGDAALKCIAVSLRKALSSEALIGRLGGEEFGVFLPGADETTAAAIADSLCVAMRREGAVVEGINLAMTVSVGGAVHVRTDNLEKTMKRADEALYQAKRSGRDRFFIIDASNTMPVLLLQASGQVDKSAAAG